MSLFIINLYYMRERERVCVCVCVFDTNCVHYFFIFWYNVICVNCEVCELWHVWMYTWYKYNITLYDLITKKYKAFVTCVYCYHVIITFYCKNNDSKKKIILILWDLDDVHMYHRKYKWWKTIKSTLIIQKHHILDTCLIN